MIDATQASTAFLLGLSGAGHCLGMCGGIAAALNLGGARSPAITLAYHSGRIASYTTLGALLGLAAASVDIAAWTIALRYLAGVLLIGMGLYIANWWRGMALLERGGAKLWQPVQRLSSNWLPLRRWPQGFALGLCWGLMPCGLIYSSLAWAATAQSAATSALMMLLFGLGTLPAMLSTSLGAARLQALLRRRGLKVVIALLLIGSGVWTLYITASHSGHSGHNDDAGQSQPLHHQH
ncbi:MAG: sulfite exporter TauE/SafE family protein [Halioglobus sp.]|nr:sulfite exporter TauE/SafE family protein [Halioglobus sp.]